MKRLKQFENLVIEDMEIDEFHRPPHHQNYYEIAFIFKGKGTAIINRQETEYASQDLFLLAPEDLHYFRIEEKTRFVFIKFNEDYFINARLKLENTNIAHLLDLFSSSYLKEIPPKWTPQERSFFCTALSQILQLKKYLPLQNSSTVYFLIAGILGCIDDHQKAQTAATGTSGSRTEILLHYLHQNIYYPEKIRIRTVAQHFHISENYFGEWFRKNFECSYKNYIDRYRTALIQNRILLQNFTLEEIADEFSFTDSSHLSRYFLHHTGLRPKAFLRKKEKKNASQSHPPSSES